MPMPRIRMGIVSNRWRRLLFVVFVCCTWPCPSQGNSAVRGDSSQEQAQTSTRRHVYESTWDNDNSNTVLYHSAEDDLLASASAPFRIVIEGHVQPRFFCKTCAEKLQIEQTQMWQKVLLLCPTAKMISSNNKLVNSLTIQIPTTCVSQQQSQHSLAVNTSAHTTAILPQDFIRLARQAFVQQLQTLTAALRVYPSLDWYAHPTDLRESVEYLGAYLTTQQFCLKGDGVRVAILDSGLDYSHEALSGNGTMAAYLEAFGTSGTDPRNTIRGTYFPTERVVDGYDFLGDIIGPRDPLGDEFASNVREDDDPIDGSLGHGTGVAHALLGIAGNAELVALKVCVVNGGCPEFAILNAMEYALDPNGDGDTTDHVDIMNLSFGRPYTHPYYSSISKAIEDAFALGVLTVVAAGNNGNRPGVMFEAASTPNALAVGATGVAESRYEGGMADYSSRGPSASTTLQIKPDLVAPGGPFDLAAAGTGNVYHKGIEGTSYAAPIVAGAAALVKQRCPECSPFAIKAILMNNANRGIRYVTVDPSKLAPISWVGAGELQVYKAISADFWAYDLVDVQPSLSLGVLNVDKDTVVSKTVRVQLLDDQQVNNAQPLSMQASFQFRDRDLAHMMRVEFFPATFELGRSCGSFKDIIVTFTIIAANVPSNHLTSAGQASIDPVLSLDPNEVDGWVIFTTTQTERKDISLPMHAIVRRAAHVELDNMVLPPISSSGETRVRLGLQNKGAGTAQIDTYELVHTSADDPEVGFGVSTAPVDFRYIGYRTVAVGTRNCHSLVEFVFHTWETLASTVTAFFEAQIDRDNNGSIDVMISNRGPQQHSTNYTECRVFNVGQSGWSCAGFAPDHAKWSTNTVIRACSNDLGLDPSTTTTMQVKFTAISFGRDFNTTDRATIFAPITFPTPTLAGPSFDVEPGSTWSDILVKGTGRTPAGQESKGLLLITNGYRSPTSTGASTRQTEAFAIMPEGSQILREQTPDQISFPKARSVAGPLCSSWTAGPSGSCNPFDNNALGSVTDFEEFFGAPPQPGANGPPVNGETCLESVRPLVDLSTRFPTDSPTQNPTMSPTMFPTTVPTLSPVFLPTNSPSSLPTGKPTRAPSDAIPDPEPTLAPTENPTQAQVEPGPADVVDEPSRPSETEPDNVFDNNGALARSSAANLWPTEASLFLFLASVLFMV